MASLSFSSISRCLPQSTVTVSDKSSPRKDIVCSLAKGNFSRKRDARDLTVTNVASPQMPVIIPLPEKENFPRERNHVAWTSVRQERWEGELVVQGQIPLWLVRDLLSLFAILHVHH